MHFMFRTCYEGSLKIPMLWNSSSSNNSSLYSSSLAHGFYPVAPVETSESMEAGTIVLGVGNPLFGDDGLGARVVALLRIALQSRAHDLPQDVRVEDIGTPGLGLPNWLEGKKRVILVDAIQMGQAAGTWRRFNPREACFLTNNKSISLHESSLADGLALSQALGLLPDELILYGVEPAHLDEGYAISPEVEAVLPDIVASILDELFRRKL